MKPCPKCKKPYNPDWSDEKMCARCFVRSTEGNRPVVTFQDIKRAYEQAMEEGE